VARLRHRDRRLRFHAAVGRCRIPLLVRSLSEDRCLLRAACSLREEASARVVVSWGNRGRRGRGRGRQAVEVERYRRETRAQRLAFRTPRSARYFAGLYVPILFSITVSLNSRARSDALLAAA
jgi:hypothetical protein